VIAFSGGEPTLREDLFELVKFVADEYPLKSTALMTNGLKLADPNYVKKIKESSLIRVIFSFNGFSDKDYEETNNAKILDIKLKALKNLKEFKVSTSISSTILRGINEKEIKPIVEYVMDNLDFISELRFRGCAKVGRYDETHPLTHSEIFDLFAEAFGKDRDYFLKRFSRNDCYHSIQQFLVTFIIDNSKNKKEILGFIYDAYQKKTIGGKINTINVILKILFKKGIKKFFQAVIESKILNFSENYKIRYNKVNLLFDKLNIKRLDIKVWWWTDKTNLDLDEMKAVGIMHVTHNGKILLMPDAVIIADEL